MSSEEAREKQQPLFCSRLPTNMMITKVTESESHNTNFGRDGGRGAVDQAEVKLLTGMDRHDANLGRPHSDQSFQVADCEEAGNEPFLVVTSCESKGDDPLMKYLDASTGTRANKLLKVWDDLQQEFGLPEEPNDLLVMAEALAKRWEEHQIVMLVDEIDEKDMLSKLGDQSFPDSVRMILVLNPRTSGRQCHHPL